MSRSHGQVLTRRAALAALIAAAAACGGRLDAGRPAVRIAGSDTMVNLVQAWAEHYAVERPHVAIQVGGGGSGTGLASLIEGTIDLAAASREIRPVERTRARARTGVDPSEVVVGFDAIALYVARSNPLDAISIGTLAEIYGEGGRLVRWSQLGIRHPACASDRIIVVGRQNNSGTFAHFRDVVLGRAREYRMGSIDQSGSKDVVALVSETPCAIGYSGMAFATAAVRTLGLAADDADPVTPSERTVADGSYPLARPLYLYAATHPAGHIKDFIDWVRGARGQRILRELGFVGA